MRLAIGCSVLAALACQPGQAPLGSEADEQNAGAGDRITPGEQITLVVTLTQTSQGPSPVGLPTRLEIVGRVPDAGSEASIAWKALDGDPARQPRSGPGTAMLAAEGEPLVLELRRAGGAPSEALVLTGAQQDAEIRGSFADALFYPRAGLFEGRLSRPQ